MSFDSVGIIGGGQMGSGIAALCAVHKVPSITIDPNTHYAKENISSQLQKFLKRQNNLQSIAEALKYVEVSDSLEKVKTVSLVIEAVPEVFELKQDVLKRVSEIVPDSTIIGTNTSSFPISKLSTHTRNPQRLMGIHFMNPVLLIDLVELIPSQLTSQVVFERVEAWLKKIEKTSVVADDQPGFTVNRILIPMINTAFELLESERVSPSDIDLAMVHGAGFPMGPLQLADMIGLDTCLSIMETLSKEFEKGAYAPALRLKRYVKEGNLGRKTGKGVYDY